MINWLTLPNLTNYENSLKSMEELVEQMIHFNAQETIMLLEHPSIYTAGSSYKTEIPETINNIPVIQTNRGGQLTYHGPGQRIIYPLLNLANSNRKKDIKLYVKMLEEWIINCLKHFGIDAFIMKDLVGVWVHKNKVPFKIAAIGIRVKKWVTFHGIAVNITPNLNFFTDIIPCGISDYSNTSLADLEVNVSLIEFDAILKLEFNKIFQ